MKTDYPVAVCELTHETPFQLLAATILSAQCTDARVNMVTPNLFRRFPDAESLAVADVREVEEIVRSTGFFGTKARNLIGMANAVVTKFGGKVPTEMEHLVTLPGVGRKTANVVRSVAFNLPGLPVDTHVGRLSRRLGLTRNDDPVKVEADLCALLPPSEWESSACGSSCTDGASVMPAHPGAESVAFPSCAHRRCPLRRRRHARRSDR